MKIKSIKIILAGILFVPLIIIGMNLALSNTQKVSASSITDSLQQGANATKNDSTPTQLFKSKNGVNSVFKNISNTALYIIGAVSVLMIIYGGIRYATSAGIAKNVTTAKEIIFYSVIGLVVAIMAYAIVDFVIDKLAPPSTTADTAQIVTSNPSLVKPEADIPIVAQTTSQTDIATIKVKFSSVLSASPRAGAKTAGPQNTPSLTPQELRNHNMVVLANYEIWNYNAGETTGDNKGPRLKVYQEYAGGSGCVNKAWCAAFVSYIHHEVTNNGNSLRSCAVSELMKQGPSKSYGKGTPIPGDILAWYGYNGSTILGHTGILTQINSNGTYMTIEGNGGQYPSKVQFFTRPASYWRTAKNNGATSGIHTGYIIP